MQCIVHQRLRGDTVLHLALAVFEGRLNALAAAHELLTKRNWEAAALEDMVRAALSPVCGEEEEARLAIGGASVPLRPKQSAAKAVHEAATNSLKH